MSFEKLQIKRATMASSGSLEFSEGLSEGELFYEKTFGKLYYVTSDSWSFGANCHLINNELSSFTISNLAESGLRLRAFLADGTYRDCSIPAATSGIAGLITPGAQTFAGDKTFTGNIIANQDISIVGDLSSYSLSTGSIYAEDIVANTVSGDLSGNAATASRLLESVAINGTAFNGSEDITTDSWGYARKILISGEAGTSGTDIDGSAETYTLIIPTVLSNFTNITSTAMYGTNLGSSSTLWENLYIKNPYIYNGSYYHLLDSSATTNRTITLPNADGLLAYKKNDTSTVGDTNSPVYVAAGGEILACSNINVAHGGTGLTSLTKGAVLAGNGTNSLLQVDPVAAGQLLVSNGTSSAPIYTTPTLDWTEGTVSGPILNFKINGETYASVAIPSARIDTSTGSNVARSGIVTTGAQTFSGAKTFSGAVTLNSTLSVTGASSFTGQISATNIKISGSLKSSPDETSYLTLIDSKATLTSPTVFLNGTTLVLNSGSGIYGSTLPTTDLEEGRVFFLLV